MANRVVSVILDSGITYVSGIVNGNEYVFTLTADNTWSADVSVSDDNVYHLTLTAIDNLGNVSTITTTLYYGLNLITDRTQADVNRYLYLKSKSFADMTEEEQLEWLSDLKGAYNFTDLNRVDGAVDYIIGRLKEIGYFVDGVKTNRLWNVQYVPNQSDMEQYLRNIRIIKNVFAMATSVPDSMEYFTHQEANAIEQILLDADYLITEISRACVQSNEVYAGEV